MNLCISASRSTDANHGFVLSKPKWPPNCLRSRTRFSSCRQQLRLTCSTLSVGRVKAEASLRDVSSGSMSGMGILKGLRPVTQSAGICSRSLKVLVFAPGLSWPKRFIQKRVQNQSEVEQTQMVTPSAQGAFRVSCSCRCRCRRRRCSPAALSGGPVRAEARDVSRWQHALGILKGLQLVL
eukprot:s416_g47.t2